MMYADSGVSYYIDKFSVFHKILKERQNVYKSKIILKDEQNYPQARSTWLRLILMFWNVKVMKAALRFGVAALIMNHYERLGFATLLLCFAL